jgi:hypothetical protein
MIRQSLFVATGAAVFAFTVGALCRAQEQPATAQQAPVRGLPVDESRTYTYRFDDDPLTAPGLDNVPRIRVRPTASRETLLRPRASFIVPLMRSVETAGDPYPAPIRVRRSSYH